MDILPLRPSLWHIRGTQKGRSDKKTAKAKELVPAEGNEERSSVKGKSKKGHMENSRKSTGGIC